MHAVSALVYPPLESGPGPLALAALGWGIHAHPHGHPRPHPQCLELCEHEDEDEEDLSCASRRMFRRQTGVRVKSRSENDELAAGCRPNPPAGSRRYRGSAGILPAGSRSFPAPGSVFLNFQTGSKPERFSLKR